MSADQQQQQFFLKWNDFQSNMVSSFKHLRDEKSFTDVTLACEGQTCKAHKMVLSACSPYFKALLEWRSLKEHQVEENFVLFQPRVFNVQDTVMPALPKRLARAWCLYPATSIQVGPQEGRRYEQQGLRKGGETSSGTLGREERRAAGPQEGRRYEQQGLRKGGETSSGASENPSKHPIIILKDVPYTHLQAILEFMYAGEVNVSQEQLPAFLKTADRLKVKGLAEAPQSIKRDG
uniref:(California timema) hypothetical protein n=2 Tax=Timema TaxID=61471 RepID=A0A7R9J4T6_TIMCA|nr:unnamed protein product [Timema californicum]